MCIDNREFDQNLPWLKEGDDVAKILIENAEKYQKNLKEDQPEYLLWYQETWRRAALLESIQNQEQRKYLDNYFWLFDLAFYTQAIRLKKINNALELYLKQIQSQPYTVGNSNPSQLVPIELIQVLEPMIRSIATLVQIELRKKMSYAHQARIEQGKKNRELLNKYFEPVFESNPRDCRKELQKQYKVFRTDYKKDPALKIFSSKRPDAGNNTPLSSTAFFNRFYRWRKHVLVERKQKEQEAAFAEFIENIAYAPLLKSNVSQ